MPLQQHGQGCILRLGVGALAQAARPSAGFGDRAALAQQRFADGTLCRRKGMTMAQILYFADLQRICAPEGPSPTPATVERWAGDQGILYKYDRRGRIWTTTDAVNAALGLHVHPVLTPEQELLGLI